MRFRIVFVRKPNSSGGLSYIPAHSSPNKVIRSGHLIGVHTHRAEYTISYIHRSRSSKSNPITCSGAASARVLLVQAHLLVCLLQLKHGLDEGARGAESGCKKSNNHFAVNALSAALTGWKAPRPGQLLCRNTPHRPTIRDQYGSG